MAEISNYLENALINATLRATTFTSPSVVYVGLYTSDPTDAGSGTEVADWRAYDPPLTSVPLLHLL